MRTTAIFNDERKEGTMYLLGGRVDNTSYETALKRIRRFITHKNGSRTGEIFFTNVHTMHLARRNPMLRRCIHRADMVLPDGSGLRLAGKLIGTPILENLNGTDFTPKILNEAELNGWTVYLLGAEPHVVELCRDRLSDKYPRLNIVGFHHGQLIQQEDQAIVNDINEKKPNILLVALGSPLQEEWIAHHARMLNVGVCLAVGGLFDFLSGTHKRAPLWIRRSGMEWLYRFFQDPKTKWARVVIEIPSFLMLLLATRVAGKWLQPVTVERRFPSRIAK
ncbi:MAG TPA: WecB/TagA/CpsF family glycosyltransferase [Bacteroidota bacterium]|jgi:N-acetylglucosaminyldiphosphoundecaprenol N-acetyl-beta-D-mannosaminyltransferase|nr:WecB/TagA/CpsF family glycosyltransferase [Bacteroidota bacterium]